MVIVAAGLSPAWQQILTFDHLQEGEVNRAREAWWCASGKVLNVGIALAHLGAEVVTIAPLGGTARGAIASEFAAWRARCEWIDVANPTRICTTLLDQATGRTTELVQNALPLTAAEISKFEEACGAALQRDSVVVLTGSIPPETPSDVFRRLLERSASRAILDIRGPELLEALECRPLVVKPNREELSQTLHRSLTSDVELWAAMAELNDRGAQWVVVSQGAKELWVSHAQQRYRVRPPKVTTVNPIGCGDCLAAGIAWQLAQGVEMPEALRAGVAAAALNAAELLPGRVSADEVLRLASSITIELGGR